MSLLWQKDERVWHEWCDNFSEPITPTEDELRRLKPKSSQWYRTDGSIAYCIDTNIFVRRGLEGITKYFRVTEDSIVRRNTQRRLQRQHYLREKIAVLEQKLDQAKNALALEQRQLSGEMSLINGGAPNSA